MLRLPDVVGIELLPLEDGEPSYGVLVRARNPQRFFADLMRLVMEEWFEVSHLEALDDSAEAVLGYLLGGRAAPQPMRAALETARTGAPVGAASRPAPVEFHP